MLIFTHLFFGIVFGILFAYLIGNNRIIPVCMIGSIVPDIIDKPLGYLLLSTSLDNGRIFCHALLTVGILIVLAIIIWRFCNTLLLFGFTVMIFLHQILDEMWLYDPVTWFYPLLGPLRPSPCNDFFWEYFMREISALPEWIFLFATIVLICIIYHNFLHESLSAVISQNITILIQITVTFISALGIYACACAVIGAINILAPYWSSQSNGILGIVALSGSTIIYLVIPKILMTPT